MNGLFKLIASVLLASIAYSQDLGDIGNLGGDVNGLLNIPAPRGNAPAGNRGAPVRGGQPNSAAIDRLGRLREVLANSNAPLNAGQETGTQRLDQCRTA